MKKTKRKKRKKTEEEFITVNMKDICFITNNPGPVRAPITDEMLERALAEIRLKKRKRKKSSRDL
jgi:hypothetical protein